MVKWNLIPDPWQKVQLFRSDFNDITASREPGIWVCNCWTESIKSHLALANPWASFQDHRIREPVPDMGSLWMPKNRMYSWTVHLLFKGPQHQEKAPCA